MCTLLACLVSGAPWWGGDRQPTKISLSCLQYRCLYTETKGKRVDERHSELGGKRERGCKESNNKTGPLQVNAKPHCTTVTLRFFCCLGFVRWISNSCFEDIWLLHLSISFSLFFPSCYPSIQCQNWASESCLGCVIHRLSSEILWVAKYLIPGVIIHVVNLITPLRFFQNIFVVVNL